MKANETKVDKFLATNETTFAIPVYQRNYDWTLFQFKQLLHDMHSSIRPNNIDMKLISKQN